MKNNQWLRKAELIVSGGETALDLSAFRVRFHTKNASEEAPNNCAIRVYNLSAKTILKIRDPEKGGVEFTKVTLNAGYENGNFGVIFQGTIMQFEVGKENAVDSYLDIFVSDGDMGYNQGVVSTPLAKGTTILDGVKAVEKAMPGTILNPEFFTNIKLTPNIRGTTLFGLSRAYLRDASSTLNASWSIQNGKIVMLENRRYLEGEAVKINVATGLIGIPTLTDEGVSIKCLLNSRLKIGGLIQLNNEEITQLSQRDPNNVIPYNQYGVQTIAPLSPDGTYMALVVEHEGDTRGTAWYSNITCLAVDRSAPKDKSVKPA